MGVVATNGIQARQRCRTARISRLVAARDANDPEIVARNQRIKAAVREARRALVGRGGFAVAESQHAASRFATNAVDRG